MNKNYLMEYSSLEKPILVIITIIMFIISPILSIVPIIIGIYFKKNMYLFFSIFFGILSMLYIPNVEYDMARHWTLFEILKEISLETFFNYLLTQKDLIHPTILYISSKVIENPQSINLILTTIIYYIFFLSLKKLEVKNKNLNILIVLTYLLTIDFLSVISGVRTALSISFSIYGFILYEEKKSIWKGLLFLILGVMSHIFAIIFIPIFLLAIFIKNNRIIKSIFGLSIVFSIIFLKGDIFLKIINNLPYLNKYLNHISVYINGSQSHFLNYNLNFNGVLKFILINFINYWINLILFLIVQSRIKQYNFYRNLCFLLFSICILLYKFPIIQERYLYIVNFVTLFFYVDNLKKLKNKFLLIIFILILRLTVTFLTNYPYRSDFIKSYTSLYLYNIILDNRQNINYKELLDNNYGKEIKVKMGEK